MITHTTVQSINIHGIVTGSACLLITTVTLLMTFSRQQKTAPFDVLGDIGGHTRLLLIHPCIRRYSTRAADILSTYCRTVVLLCWRDQSVTNEKLFLANFEQRLKDTFIQNCISDVESSNKCRMYPLKLKPCLYPLKISYAPCD